jgi:hypothetical protein
MVEACWRIPSPITAPCSWRTHAARLYGDRFVWVDGMKVLPVAIETELFTGYPMGSFRWIAATLLVTMVDTL